MEGSVSVGYAELGLAASNTLLHRSRDFGKPKHRSRVEKRQEWAKSLR